MPGAITVRGGLTVLIGWFGARIPTPYNGTLTTVLLCRVVGIWKEAVELRWADYWTGYARLTVVDDRISKLYGDGGS
jgi:hypothetical protein